MTLEILTSDLLAPARHGFFTRIGGASSGIFAGLNCGHGSSDQSEVVSHNRSLVAKALDVTPENLVSLYQYHSADILVAEGPFVPARPKADGMVCSTKGVALAVLSADCMPVLFSDANAGVVGAAHAGWKGALGGVLEALVLAMVNLGARRADISAVIGPCIGQPAYEVGPEFYDHFTAQDASYAKYFVAGQQDRMLFDLPGFGLSRLQNAGLKTVAWTGHCTFSAPDRFFSYRRATKLGQPDYGRLISAIRL